MKKIIIFARIICIFLVIVSTRSICSNKGVIYLISSSSAYNENIINKIKNVLEKQDFDVSTKYLNQQISDFGYVNTDKERAKILIQALTDNNVKYLWFIRGGSGAINIFPDLFNNIKNIKNSQEKIIIGFSDVTAIHYFLNTYIGWKSIHGIVAAYNKDLYSNKDQEKINMNNGFQEVVTAIKKGVSYNGLLPMNSQAHSSISGILGGGNLTLIQSFFSTKYEKYLPCQILLLEDTGVTYKQLDRILNQIFQKNKKNFKLQGIIFGQFYSLSGRDEERLMFKTVIKEFARKITIPVYYYPYFGHGKTNNPLILRQKTLIKCHMNNEFCQLTQAGI
ncbi:LD-carboxypeptidase [Candidatus Gillettellia adelgis]